MERLIALFIKDDFIKHFFAASHKSPRPSAPAWGRSCHELYRAGMFDEILASVEACLPKDVQGNLILEQEIKGFLGWLEGEVGARVEDLSPKTKIQSYYDYDYDDFYAVLKKNRKRLSINPSAREKAELLKVEFTKSMAKLGPLQERIERTDRLIDAVVYKLYGLAEKEIEIVEGT